MKKMYLKVLFICTGNFYRSRFCAGLFNFLAEKEGIGARAFSRGLDVSLADDASKKHNDEISKDTKKRLKELRVPLEYAGEKRTPLSLHDLEFADLTYAVMESEHRPMMREQFPEWENKINYWDIGDLPHKWTPSESLGLAEIMVKGLISTLDKV